MTDNVLGQTLRSLREHAGKSIPTVATEVGIDRRYLYHLEHQDTDWLHRPLEGQPAKQPSRDLIIRIAIALGLDIDQTDELLMLAGYAPLFPIGRTTGQPARAKASPARP